MYRAILMVRPTRGRTGEGRRSEETKRVLTVTTYRIYADQRDALQHAALEQRGIVGGGGRADASAVLRDLLDKAGMRARK